MRSRASFKNAEMTWSNTIVKYEQHFVILNFGVNERTVTEKLWRCWDGWKFENFRKIRGEERFQPRPQSLLIGKREDPGAVRQRSWFQTSRWPQILKWSPKREHILRTDEVSNLNSVVKILSEFRTPCVLFTSTRPSKSRPLGSQMIKKSARCRRVWAVWLRPRNHWYLWKNARLLKSTLWSRLWKNVSYNNRRFCYLMIC